MCGCPVRMTSQYCSTDALVELEKVRIHQRHETHTSCEAFSLAAFEYEFGALDRLDKPITNTCLGLVYVFLLRCPLYFPTNPE